MKITKIKIGRFAGIRDFEADFGDHLNVIYGPNEIGKSTLTKAIKFALFIPPNITNNDLRGKFGFILADFIPKSGGDRIDVELDFVANGVTYHLRKTFGSTAATKFSELQFGHTQLNDHLIVQAELNRVLGMAGDSPKMNVKAWMDVIFANQASLSNTIANIKSNDQVKNSLAELMSQLDGISIEEFKDRVENELSALSQRWILKEGGVIINRPIINGGQGDFDRPYINGRGEILKSYYAVNNARKALSDRQDLENRYDQIVQSIRQKQAIIDDGNGFLTVNRAFEASLVQRRVLQADLEREGTRLDQINQIIQNWMRLELEIANFPATNQVLTNDLLALQEELRLATQLQDVERIRGQVAQLTSLQTEIQALEAQLRGLASVEADDLTKAAEYSQDLHALQIQLEAQKLKIKLHAKMPLGGTYQLGLDEAVAFNLPAGEVIDLEASTQYIFESNELKLEISAGEEEVESLNHRFANFTQGLQQILAKYGVTSYTELQNLNREYHNRSARLNQLRGQFDLLLNGQDFDTLNAQITGANAIQARSVAVLNGLIAQTTHQQNQLVQTNQNNQTQINRYIADHTNQVALLTKLGELNANINTLQVQITNLPKRPDGFDSDEAFGTYFEEIQANVRNASTELGELVLQRAELLNDYGTGASAEDLTLSVSSLQQNYDALVAKGLALLQIQEKLEEIENELGANPFGDLANRVNSYLARLSNGRYSEVAMEDVAPKGIEKDGVILDNHILSQGTADILALATRLAMADFYLGDEDGFLLLDDPFTELDDSRKVAASQLLGEISEGKQVIVFTCHSSHKDLMGGQLVELA